jgi:predicted small lipoprotein YifL
MAPFAPHRFSARTALVLLAALLLSACGNKGPLVRPAPDTPAAAATG